MVPVFSSLLILTDCSNTWCWAIFLNVKLQINFYFAKMSLAITIQQLNKLISIYLVQKTSIWNLLQSTKVKTLLFFFSTSQERAQTSNFWRTRFSSHFYRDCLSVAGPWRSWPRGFQHLAPRLCFEFSEVHCIICVFSEKAHAIILILICSTYLKQVTERTSYF